MDIVMVESTTNVCIFGLGITLLALVVYKTGSFIDRNFDEADQLEEQERNEKSMRGNRCV